MILSVREISLLFDIGSIFDGYHSDTTRTVAIKSADEEMKKVYDIVLKAQLAVLDSVKPGAKCSDVDKIARDIIRKTVTENISVMQPVTV